MATNNYTVYGSSFDVTLISTAELNELKSKAMLLRGTQQELANAVTDNLLLLDEIDRLQGEITRLKNRKVVVDFEIKFE